MLEVLLRLLSVSNSDYSVRQDGARHRWRYKTRIHIPEGVYHVTLRGDGGHNILFCDDDRCHLCLLLREGVSFSGHGLHVPVRRATYIWPSRPRTSPCPRLSQTAPSCIRAGLTVISTGSGTRFKGDVGHSWWRPTVSYWNWSATSTRIWCGRVSSKPDRLCPKNERRAISPCAMLPRFACEYFASTFCVSCILLNMRPDLPVHVFNDG